MPQLPPPHHLKAVELGLVDPEAIVPREWLYDFCILCPATPEDCVGFFRNYGITSDVDDNTYLALLAGGFFRHVLDAKKITHLLVSRFGRQAALDSGLKNCLENLTNPDIHPNHAYDICLQVLFPYQEMGEKLLGHLPAPDEFTCYIQQPDWAKDLHATAHVAT
jgi:hypothetical protein